MDPAMGSTSTSMRPFNSAADQDVEYLDHVHRDTTCEFVCSQPIRPEAAANTPKTLVTAISDPATHAYQPVSRYLPVKALRASRNKKPRTSGSSKAFMTCTATDSLTRSAPEVTKVPPATKMTLKTP